MDVQYSSHPPPRDGAPRILSVDDEPGIVQYAGGVCGESIENLAVELRERRRSARIKIKNAERLPIRRR